MTLLPLPDIHHILLLIDKSDSLSLFKYFDKFNIISNFTISNHIKCIYINLDLNSNSYTSNNVWEIISSNSNIPIDFIIKFKNYFNWNILSFQISSLNVKILKILQTNINWIHYICSHNINDDILNSFSYLIDFNLIFKNKKFRNSFMAHYNHISDYWDSI
jgi:hypothetical protein